MSIDYKASKLEALALPMKDRRRREGNCKTPDELIVLEARSHGVGLYFFVSAVVDRSVPPRALPWYYW